MSHFHFEPFSAVFRIRISVNLEVFVESVEEFVYFESEHWSISEPSKENKFTKYYR